MEMLKQGRHRASSHRMKYHFVANALGSPAMSHVVWCQHPMPDMHAKIFFLPPPPNMCTAGRDQQVSRHI
jgi:hypothetical protein